MATYNQRWSKDRLPSSLLGHRAWRFALIAVLLAGIAYAAVRIGNHLRNANGTHELRMTSGGGQNALLPENTPAPEAMAAPADTGRTEKDRATALPSIGAASGVQNRPDGIWIGYPQYVPIAVEVPEEPAAGGEYVFTGTVTSEQGIPLPGATVSVYRSLPPELNLEWPAPVASEACDAAGHYTLRLKSLLPAR